jgi:hypothetical protein
MLLARSYKNIVAYGNHFKANIWHGISSPTTYDVGVMAEFEHLPPITRNNLDPQPEQMQHIGECKEVLKLHYGLTTMTILLCFYVQVTTCGAKGGTRRDEHGFLLVNFKRLLEQEQPFCLPFTN